MRLWLFFAAILLFSFSLPSHASSIVLDSVSGGTYTYGLDIAGPGQVAFDEGDTITLTGLSGVTGVTAGPIGFFYADGFFSTAFTSTSVTLTYDNSQGIIYPSGDNTDFTPFFSLTSTATLEGPAAFAVDSTDAFNVDLPVDFSGQVEGPVAAAAVTPEPSTFALIATGMACVTGIKRRQTA